LLRKRKVFKASLLCLFIFKVNLFASSLDYLYPFYKPSYSNYGGLGNIQNPTARFFDEGTISFSWSHNDPYLRGSIIAYPFNWMEASFQYTDINNQLYSLVEEFSGSQSLKDKSFDLKLKIYQEKGLLPNAAIGWRDLAGTGLFSSEYIVLNKRVRPNLDISIGLGWGNLNANKIDNPLINLSESFRSRSSTQGEGGKFNIKDFFSGDAGVFGGIEYAIPARQGIVIKVEYDGTNYVTESRIPLRQDSKINAGVVYSYSENFKLKANFVRGNTLNFGFSYSLPFAAKNPLNIKKEPKKSIDNSEIIRNVTSKSDELLFKASLLYLSRNEINLQMASIEDKTLHVVYSQPKIKNHAQSAGRTIDLLHQISPDKIEEIKISKLNGALGMFSFSADRNDLDRYERFSLPSRLYKNSSLEEFNFSRDKDNFQFKPEIKYPVYFNSIGPDLRSQIGGPDGFFFGDLKATFNSEVLFNRNVSLISVASYGLYDNMDELKLASDSILPHVRTDIVQYLKQSRGFSVRRLQLNYYKQLNESIYFKTSGGVLESMFNGVGLELLYRPLKKNYGIGIELWQVFQRDYDQMFKTLDYDTLTGHLTLYYQEPKSNILFQIKGGRYLAKDSGFTFDFSRRFRNSLRMGVFFSLTDISAEEFGEGSFDKGFYFWIPVDLFSRKYTKKNFGWGLRPITRDGAQSIIHGYPLWGVTDGASELNFYNGIDDFYN